MAELEDALHARPSQVEISVLESDTLIGRRVIFDRKRRSLRASDDHELRCLELDLAGRHRGILRASRSRRHHAFNFHDKLETQLGRETPSFKGLEHDLERAPTVTQVDEDQAAMVAPARDPSV